jgi:hypothetical protein
MNRAPIKLALIYASTVQFSFGFNFGSICIKITVKNWINASKPDKFRANGNRTSFKARRPPAGRAIRYKSSPHRYPTLAEFIPIFIGRLFTSIPGRAVSSSSILLTINFSRFTL